MTQENHIIIDGALEQISQAVQFVTDMAEQAGLNEQAVYHCQLAVDEACTNIVEHGYTPTGLFGVIIVSCRIEPSRFIITILDDSPAYNPLTRTDPNPKAILDERAGGGWGVFFIKKVMDQVSYFYEGRNRLVMVKEKNGEA
jgi:anti-sigma regulatory factor (Ser/Thr protein kinase)